MLRPPPWEPQKLQASDYIVDGTPQYLGPTKFGAGNHRQLEVVFKPQYMGINSQVQGKLVERGIITMFESLMLCSQ